MANKTAKEAVTVHGTNPQYLIEKIIRSRIYESRYWKEDCFALSADLVVDKGADLRYIGGIYSGNIKPTPFLCLTLKLLQLQPEKDIIIEFIRQDSFKYIRALGAFYLRLTSNSLDVYKYLEPLYNDYRKLRRMSKMGTFDLIYMDEFVDMLLREDRVFDVILPRLTKRFLHVENGELEKRVSLIDEDLDLEGEEGEDQGEEDKEREDGERSSSSDSEVGGRRARRRSRSADRDRRDRRRGDRDELDHRGSHRDSHHRRSDHRSDSLSPHRRSRYERDRGGRRSTSRERHRRDRGEDDRRRSDRSSPDDRGRSDRRREERKERSKKKEAEKTAAVNTEGDEIAQANALRARLGLKPLRL